MANLTHTQIRSLAGSFYRVVSSITNPSGMPGEVFVFHTADSIFSRVASVEDLQTLLASKAAAQSAGDAYYRSVNVTRDFEELEDAQDFALLVTERLPALVKQYNQLVTDFLGTSTTTVTS